MTSRKFTLHVRLYLFILVALASLILVRTEKPVIEMMIDPYSLVSKVSEDRDASPILSLSKSEEGDTKTCVDEKLKLNDILLTSLGLYTATFTNKVGCDSLVNVDRCVINSFNVSPDYVQRIQTGKPIL